MSSPFRFFDLEGKTLAITGITRGIGRAFLPVFLEQGMNIVAVSKGMERMQAIREELQVGEDRLRLFDCDLADTAAVQATAESILQSDVSIDGFLHNAAIDPREHFSRGDEAFWNQVFQINLFSGVTLARKLLPKLEKSSQGRILFTGSVLLGLGGGCLTAYTATKGALDGLTRSLAHELKHTNITVNCVVPGAIQVEKEAPSPEKLQRIAAWQSVGRRLDPGDLIGLTCLLLSEAGGGISGQSITVDGGIVHPLASPDFQGRTLTPPWPLES